MSNAKLKEKNCQIWLFIHVEIETFKKKINTPQRLINKVQYIKECYVDKSK